ncbi:MAG: hypothetical protein KatS3mg006_0208 [Pyrinomonadaceae bacterium]|nr:MAG: hypothetical protein KatS3mg006_0208 [Pyrinomonadaceae bacterium]
MTHLVYLCLFSLFISIMFAILSEGNTKERLLLGIKTFAKFVGISLGIAWIFYLLFS